MKQRAKPACAEPKNHWLLVNRLKMNSAQIRDATGLTKSAIRYINLKKSVKFIRVGIINAINARLDYIDSTRKVVVEVLCGTAIVKSKPANVEVEIIYR